MNFKTFMMDKLYVYLVLKNLLVEEEIMKNIYIYCPSFPVLLYVLFLSALYNQFL